MLKITFRLIKLLPVTFTTSTLARAMLTEFRLAGRVIVRINGKRIIVTTTAAITAIRTILRRLRNIICPTVAEYKSELKPFFLQRGYTIIITSVFNSRRFFGELRVATLLTYLTHIRANNMITEKQIESGNTAAYVQSMRSRITYLARSRILLSFIIQNLSLSRCSIWK